MSYKKRIYGSVYFWLLALVCIAVLGCSPTREEAKVLCFVHREAGSLVEQLQALSQTAAWEVIFTQDPAFMVEDTLKNYSAVVIHGYFIDTLNHRQQRDLERYILAGSGVLGISLQTRYQHKWPWIERTLSVYDSSVQQSDHVAILASSAADTVWQMQHGQGSLYLLTEEQAQSANILSEAITQAIGENAWPEYEAVTLSRVPFTEGFSEKILADDLNEPIELEVLPNGNVLFIERGGNVKYYHQLTHTTRTIARINVDNSQSNGLNGLAIDPDFRNNHWAYFSYTPANDPHHQHISRFFLAGDSLIMRTEKIVMKVLINARHGGHAENALEFDKHGNLYISFGDFTHDPSGYAAIDEREGHSRHDAQRTAANSRDYRGKILRIHPEPDGSYSIPEGNLFSKDGSQGYPEIYIMGCRNPYRFSIDPHTDFLYFGDIGPDAGVDGLQGHRGYDEVNRAAEAGFYGWPYFVANNKPYPDYNFATGEVGRLFDAETPYNDSPNNTGIRQLPPACPALIWYPYDITYEFPYVGKGGMNIMAGPVYHYDDFPGSSNKLPAYYDDKLIIYDWVRNWMLAATFDEQYNLLSLEPFLEFIELSKPVDMTFGPDGSLYVLEYGAMGYAANKDAKIRRITYPTGNRPTVAHITADKTEGAAPLTVNFSAEGSVDHDRNDALQYTWIVEENKELTGKEIQYVFEQPGVYTPIVRVTDREGAIAEAKLTISVGNAPPEITVDITGNQSFYWGVDTLSYQISVEDQEDGSLEDRQIQPSEVKVTFAYEPARHDKAPIGFHQANDIAKGAALVDASGCMSCHDLDVQSVGPSYAAVAERYKETNDTYQWLSRKIREGGKGKWPGNLSMPAHPYLTEEETRQMIAYILSLEQGGNRSNLPVKGTLITNQHQPDAYGNYIFTVSYKDKGANGIGSIPRKKEVVLRHPELKAATSDAQEGALIRAGDRVWVLENGGFLRFDQIDLTNIGAISFKVRSRVNSNISVRLDAPDGPEIGAAVVEKNDADWTVVNSPIQSSTGVHDLYFVFTSSEDFDIQQIRYLLMADHITFEKDQPINP